MKKLNRKWDRRYFELAEFVSLWSKDPTAQVGAVLLDEETWPIALGYNGFPSGVEDRTDKLTDQDLKLKMIVHAEQNALLCAGPRAKRDTLYVFGKPVCPRCAVLIIQAGVGRVVAVRPNPRKNPGSTTHQEGPLSLKMFREARVTFSAAPM